MLMMKKDSVLTGCLESTKEGWYQCQVQGWQITDRLATLPTTIAIGMKYVLVAPKRRLHTSTCRVHTGPFCPV